MASAGPMSARPVVKPGDTVFLRPAELKGCYSVSVLTVPVFFWCVWVAVLKVLVSSSFFAWVSVLTVPVSFFGVCGLRF